MKEGKGVSKEQNTPRLFLFFQVFFRKFWNLILVNLLYFLFCIPIVTIGPATAGFTKIMRNYAREEHAFIWGDFIEAFKKNFMQSLLYSIIDLLITSFLLYDLYIVFQLIDIASRIMMILSLAAIFLTLTVWTFMRYYIYNMIVTFRLTFKQLFKNAFIFCWAGFWRNLFLTIILAGVTFLLLYYTNYITLPLFFVTIYLSFCGFLTNFMVNPLIKKFMIDGFDPETGARLEDEKYEGFTGETEKDELDSEE